MLGLIISLLAIVLLATACGDPSALDRAEASKLLLETEAKLEAERVEQTARLARERAEWESNYRTNVVRKDGLLFAFSALSVLGAGALGFVLLWRLRQTTLYASDAFKLWASQRADLDSRLIHLDENTRTWPALVTGEGVHQLETGRVLVLDAPRDADTQAEWASMFIRALGIAEEMDWATARVPSFMCEKCREPTDNLKRTLAGSDGSVMACVSCRTTILQGQE